LEKKGGKKVDRKGESLDVVPLMIPRARLVATCG
jgi:hypothetical protein